MKRVRPIKPDERVSVTFTARERTLVMEHTFAGPEATEPLERARPTAGRYTVRYTLDDIDDLLGYVAAEANHSKSKALQKELDALYDRLKAAMESYDDGQWQNPLEPHHAARSEPATARARLTIVRKGKRP